MGLPLIRNPDRGGIRLSRRCARLRQTVTARPVGSPLFLVSAIGLGPVTQMVRQYQRQDVPGTLRRDVFRRCDMAQRDSTPDENGELSSDVRLRQVTASDLPILFEQQRDLAANEMAAFTARDPADWDAFASKWQRILGNETITVRTVLVDGHVAGYVLIYVNEEFGKPEVVYWYGRAYWGEALRRKRSERFWARSGSVPCTVVPPTTTSVLAVSSKSVDSRSSAPAGVSPTRATRRSRKSSSNLAPSMATPCHEEDSPARFWHVGSSASDR